MARGSSELIKENDYTIRQIDARMETLADGERPLRCLTRLTRSFNFRAAQVTTITETLIFQAGQTPVCANNTIIQNFQDLPSDSELREMHRHLRDRGGHPPALSSLPNNK